MRRFIARVLRIPDRRDEHLLETAMRTTPSPVPPAGLRDQLVTDALAAAERAIPQRRRSRLWLAWAAPAAALVVLAAWLAFGGHGAKQAPVPQTDTRQMATTPNAPTPPLPGTKAPSIDDRKASEDKQATHTLAHQVKRVPEHRPKPHRIPRNTPIPKQPEMIANEEPAPEQPVIVVKVGPRHEGTVSCARAAARDENGVRTEWAIYSGRKAGEYREEMCVSDSDGRGFCLTTTSSNDQLNKLEETL